MTSFKKKYGVIGMGVFAGFIALTAFLNYPHSSRPLKEGHSFAVIELFTSEGCSSCPAADDAVAKIAKEFTGEVYVLGFHVDYWDKLGWEDVYSSVAYTNRQKEYVTLFSLNGGYTPQVVINGKTEFVGSNENKLRTTVQEELKTASPATVSLTAKKTGDRTVTVSYTVSGAAESVLNIALVQLHATSAVRRGENGGKKLEHINIVREFKTADMSKGVTGTKTFSIPRGKTPEDVHIIGFVQAKQNRQVLAAAEAVIE
jgi:hypothetical protein